MKRSVLTLCLFLLLLTGWSITAQGSGGYVVIVHSDNPISEISKSDLSGLLLKKRSKWEHGVSADPADLDSGSDVRAAFSEDVHGRSVTSIKNYWQRQIFSGRGVPPKEMKDDSEMLSHVASDPGAVGYVAPSASLPDNVKRVRIVG